MSLLTGLVPSANLERAKRSMASGGGVTHGLPRTPKAVLARDVLQLPGSRKPVAVVVQPDRDMTLRPRVLAYVRAHPQARPAAIALALDLPARKVRSAINKARERGDLPRPVKLSKLMIACLTEFGPQTADEIATKIGQPVDRVRKNLGTLVYMQRLDRDSIYRVVPQVAVDA